MLERDRPEHCIRNEVAGGVALGTQPLQQSQVAGTWAGRKEMRLRADRLDERKGIDPRGRDYEDPPIRREPEE